MSSFTKRLMVSPFNDDMTLWILTEAFDYVIGDLETGTELVHCPTGFVTDFATTKWFKWILPPTGRYGKACVIHDYLCERKTICDRNGNPVRKATRKEADAIFLEAMKVLGVNIAVRYVMYFGVRLWAIVKNRE